jgi:RNA polymerase sigma factor (sigma-70 family)
MTDFEIIDQILAGNKESIRLLIARYSTPSLALAMNISKDQSLAKDIVQDSFIAVYEKLNTFKKGSKFSTWLYQIVYRQSLKQTSKASSTIEWNENENDIEDDGTFVENQEVAALQNAMKLLPTKDKLIIELFYYQEQSIEEMSKILDISTSNTKVSLHRARLKLKEIIHKNGGRNE